MCSSDKNKKNETNARMPRTNQRATEEPIYNGDLMKRTLLSFLFIIISAATLLAQGVAGSRTYSLTQCIEIALKRNYDIQYNKAQLKSADARVMNAFGEYLPAINFSMGYNRNLNPVKGTKIDIGGVPFEVGGEDPNSYRMNAYATYTIFDGFSREANYSSAKDSYSSIELNSDQTRKRVELQVTHQYIDVIKYSQIVRIRQENLSLGNKQLEQIKAQYNAGVVPISNVYAQEAENGNQELELVRSENDFNQAKATLMTTMGMQPDMDINFDESSVPTLIEEEEIRVFKRRVGSMSACIKNALSNRKDYEAARLALDASKSSVVNARSGYFPRLTASGGWYWSNNEFVNFDQARSSLDLSLSVPIFNNFRTNYQLQNAKLQVRQSEIQLLEMEQAIRSNVQSAYLNFEAAEKQLNITNKTLISAEQNYFATKERYDVGSASITEFLMASNQLVTTQINRINSVFTFVQAQKNLLYTIGML